MPDTCISLFLKIWKNLYCPVQSANLRHWSYLTLVFGDYSQKIPVLKSWCHFVVICCTKSLFLRRQKLMQANIFTMEMDKALVRRHFAAQILPSFFRERRLLSIGKLATSYKVWFLKRFWFSLQVNVLIFVAFASRLHSVNRSSKVT